ncbi:MAG: anti-sigma factor [Chloroflexi bacterium]|nr:anti-sigma factor [Chloroflexota bacterium]
MNCSTIQDLLPSYALGALEPSEREAVEAHLPLCSECVVIARDYLQAAASLSTAQVEVEPPSGLKERILRQIARMPQQLPMFAMSGITGYRIGRWTLPSIFHWATPAAAALSLLFAGALLLTVGDMQEEMRLLRSESELMEEKILEQRELAYFSSTPGVDTVMLESDSTQGRVKGMMLVNKDRTWGMLLSQGLEHRGGMGYQLWLIKDGQRVSGGTFYVDETGWAVFYVRFPQPLTQFNSIGVTMEPLEGSPGPTSSAVLSARIQQLQ